jgi:hypothetical protein
VFRLRRDTGGLDGVRTSKEIVYGIASMTAPLSPPAHVNHYRAVDTGQWKIDSTT